MKKQSKQGNEGIKTEGLEREGWKKEASLKLKVLIIY